MQRNHNKLIHQHAPKISPSELSLPRETRRTLAQLRTNKSPILISYLHKVDETHHPSPLCPLCKTHPHTTDHLFNCTHLYTSSNILDLWLSPERDHVEETPGRASLEKLGCRTPPQLHAGGVGRQQQQDAIGDPIEEAYIVGSHECLLLFTPSCCCECFYHL